MGRVSLLVCSFFFFALFSPQPAAQIRQDPSSVTGYSFNVSDTSLAVVLQQLVRLSGTELVYDPSLIKGRTTSCIIDTTDPEIALRCLLEDTGLDFERLPSNVYVLREKEADRPPIRTHDTPPQTAKYTISGFIRDAETGEDLIGAHVFIPDRRIGTASNAYGFFSLTLPSDSVSLLVSYLGYEPNLERLYLDEDLTLIRRLQPLTLTSIGIEVVGERIDQIEDQTQMSTVTLPVNQVQSLPSILGEVDVLRTLQMLPGVQSGVEGLSGLYVRGGSPDQTLILLDGAPVYNIFHFFGFFSVFNSDAVKHVQLIKGGFPARYGGRLSSVLDLGMKEGHVNKARVEAAVGIIASRLTVEGPIGKGKSSFILSGRRTYLDLLTRPLMPKNANFGYYFYDLNAKLNHIFSPRDRLFVSVYSGKDRFGGLIREDNNRLDLYMQWGNLTSTMRWNHLLTNRLFSNVLVLYSRYQFDVGIGTETGLPVERFELDYTSGITDRGLKIDFDYLPAPHHYVRFGVSGTYHTFSPGALQLMISTDLEDAVESSVEVDALEYSIYVEDDVQISNRLKTNVGLHISGFLVDQKRFDSIQPRFSLRYLTPYGWAMKASYASMKQYIHLLTNSSLGLPTDLWLPATRKVGPEKAQQVAAGLARSFLDHQYEISMEAYYKWMDHLIEYKNGTGFSGIDRDWQDKIESGKGWSYGAELFLQKKTGRTTGWLGYTLSWTNRRFANLNRGNIFPYRYDRRHDISLVLTHHISPRVELSGAWTYVSGSAITLPSTVYYSHPFVQPDLCLDCTIESYEARNNYRMRPYHRLDLGVNFHKEKRNGSRTFSMGVYNAYNRNNPFFIWLAEGGTLRQVNLFPSLPYASYRRTFN